MKYQSNWILSPLKDGIFFFAGLWLIIPLFMAYFSDSFSFVVSSILFVSFLFLWGGHNATPMIICFSSKKLFQVALTKKTRLFLLPLLLTVISVTGELLTNIYAKDFRVFGIFRPNNLILLVYLFWTPWHFGNQHYGILSIYDRLQNNQKKSNYLDAIYCRVLFCLLLPLGWFTQSVRFGTLFHLMPEPTPMGNLAKLVILLTFVFWLYMIVRELRNEVVSVPRLLYLTLVAAQPILGTLSYFIFHYALFTASHYLISITLASHIEHKLDDQKEGFYKGRSYLFYFASMILISPIVYYFIYSFSPSLSTRGFFGVLSQLHFDSSTLELLYTPIRKFITPSGEKDLQFSIARGVYFGLAFTHYIYDRFIYSFSNDYVRNTVGKALFSSKAQD